MTPAGSICPQCIGHRRGVVFHLTSVTVATRRFALMCAAQSAAAILRRMRKYGDRRSLWVDMAAVPKFTPHPKCVPGDFYVENGQCLACGVPHVVAPDLVGWTDEKFPHCFWKKQPGTPAEIERAIKVLEVQELECHRYAGTDPAILDRLLSTSCDYPGESPRAPQQTNPRPLRFALLDDRPGPLSRAWR